MIRDTIENSSEICDIRMSPGMKQALGDLRAFMFERIYTSPMAVKEHKKAEKIVGDLFTYYMEHSTEMNEEFLRLMEEGEEQEQTVCDYIACMTDRFAVSRFQELFVPKEWNIR